MLVRFPEKRSETEVAVEPEKPKERTPLYLGVRHFVEMFADREGNRYALECVLYNGARKEIVATDSRTMCVVEVQDGPEYDLMIPSRAMALMWSAIPKKLRNDHLVVTVTEADGVVTLQWNDLQVSGLPPEGRFPRYQDVATAPSQREHSVVIQFDSRLLGRICDYATRIVTNGEKPVVEMHLGTSGDICVVKCRTEHEPETLATALVMPLSP